MTGGSKSAAIDLRIRTMAERDIEFVAALEKEIFTDPWPKSAFTEALEGSEWGALVAENAEGIVGYGLYLIVDKEAHLTNIAVVPEHRRKSVAKRLLDYIFTVVEGHGCEFILLEVRPSNQEAIAFYKKYGFRLLYSRPNYYRRPIEDALVMVRYFD